MVDTDVAGLKELIKSLKEKNMVAIASDQVPKQGLELPQLFLAKKFTL